MAQPQATSFTFQATLGRNTIDLPFNFNQTPFIPGRICAITGPSGSGKTSILQHIARAVREKPTPGQFLFPAPHFQNLVTHSHDPLSNIEDPPPGEPNDPAWRTHCNLTLMAHLSNQPYLQAALEILANEPSFKNSGTDPLNPETSLSDHWPTAHKLACSLVTALAAGLPRGSLALIDEPEYHLGPSLQAALMAALHNILDSTDSYAIITTNSPVLLQEIPSQQVHVLTRYGSTTKTERPSIETYGENIGSITRHVLHLNAEHQGYMDTLKSLASEFSTQEIEDMFHRGLSSQARALLMQFQHRQRKPD